MANNNFMYCSLNCDGLSRSTDYINSFLSSNDCNILCLQETWLLESNLHKLGMVHSDYLYTGKSAVDQTKEIICGRPHGGVAILYNKSISQYVRPINICNKRVCGITFQLNMSVKILILSVYMPCDNYSSNNITEEYADVIDTIEGLLHSSHCEAFIICGDYNTCFNRKNAQTQYLTDFITRNKLLVSWDNPLSMKDYTYTNYALDHRSCIDHFVVSRNIYDSITANYVVLDALNPSTHNIVVLCSVCDTMSNYKKEDMINHNTVYKCAWNKSTDDNIIMYKDTLNSALSHINIPHNAINCSDVLCRDAIHLTAIDDLCSAIIDACIRSSKQCIPSAGSSGRTVAGWSQNVKSEKEHSLFWHWIWIDCGKPTQGHVYMIMKQTRLRYHYAVRKAKQCELEVRKERLAESVCKGSEFWKELRKINPTIRNIPNTVDGVTGSKNIAELFVKKYESLYNSVPTDKSELDSIYTCLNESIASNNADFYVSHVIIKECISKLKSGKSDGNVGFDSDHLINSCGRLHVLLSIMFNAMLCHGHTPNALLYSSIVSLPKDMRASLCCGDNYRGISLCSAICKLFDILIIDKYGNCFKTSDMQFGFKKDHSTVMCTAIYIETINYYRQRNSNVFSCLLDASKAFDKVHFGKLFKMLMKRKLPAVITRYLLDSYMRQELCVLWNSHKSRYFNVSNGVKQGGVLSPILFTVYIDDLLLLLKAAKLGCHVNHTYVGALCYADDITLLSPSLRALNKMITICELFAKKYYITFNIKKTVCIKFGSDVNIDEGAYMYGKRLEWSDTVKHLGNIVNKDLDDLDDCKIKGGVFIGSVNKLLGNFGKLQPNIVYNLFNSYCCSFYGSQLWNPNSPGFRKCCINWNKATRRILCLPSRTHTWMLGPLSDQLHISTQLYIRSVKFIVCLLRSKNEIVHCIMNNAVSNAMSPLGNKIAFLHTCT